MENHCQAVSYRESSGDRSSPYPVVYWPGGKGSMLPQLRPLLPAVFNRYLAPFCGALSDYLHLWSSGLISSAWLCDANWELATLHMMVKADADAVVEEFRRLARSHSRGFFIKVRSADPRNLTEVQVAGRMIYLTRFSYNGQYRVDERGRFSTGLGHDRTGKKLGKIDEGNVLLVAEALQAAEIVSADFSAVLGRAASRDFVFLDPPYYATCCDYTAVRFSECDHRRLRSVCSDLDRMGALWMQTNSDCRFVRNLYAEYRTTEAVVRRLDGSPNGSGKAKEVIITNY